MSKRVATWMSLLRQANLFLDVMLVKNLSWTGKGHVEDLFFVVHVTLGALGELIIGV